MGARGTLVVARAQRLVRSRLVQESEEPIVVTKPGNAGGARGLWFGVRSNEAEGGGLA
jgi:hypothetical protein